MRFKSIVLKMLPGRLKKKYVMYLLKKEGEGFAELPRKYYRERYSVDIGMYTYGGCFAVDFNIGGKVSLGRYCSIAGNVHYFGANHPINYISSSAFFYNKSLGLNVKDVKRETLVIGNDVWIGQNVIILSGCHRVGNGAVIGAGAIVTHDVPPYSIVVGNPAKILRYRFSEKEQQALEKSEWWRLTPEFDKNGIKCQLPKNHLWLWRLLCFFKKAFP